MPTNNSNNSPKCSFCAYKSSTTTNVTGSGTSYDYICDTEKHDTGSNYDTGTGVFTAPIDGNYFFATKVFCTGCTIATSIGISLITTPTEFFNSYWRAASNADLCLQIKASVYLTAGQTCFPRVLVIGEAAQTVDVLGDGAMWTNFYGFYIGH
jgi:hypothetical protein